MYYFNYKLIGKLPELLGMGKKDFASSVGTTFVTYKRWAEGEITCLCLVNLCNSLHISLSHFFVLEENVELKPRCADYITPEQYWQPVQWNNGVPATLFGNGGLLGVSKSDAASMLGFSSYQIFDQWAASPSAAKVKDVLNLINTFRMDASQFFSDPNSIIPAPLWELDGQRIANILKGRLDDYQSMERRFKNKEKELVSMRVETERLRREVALLRQSRETGNEGSVYRGMIPDPANPFQRRGYVFHLELWKKMPELLDMTHREFCHSIGIGGSHASTFDNVLLRVLADACNLYRISISHFFLPKGEVAAVHDLGYYQVSPRLFKPVELHMERMKFLFDKDSCTGFSINDVVDSGLAGRTAFSGYVKADSTARVITLCDICTQFNLPPWIFFDDENRRKAVYSQSQNERLLLNAIRTSEENKRLKQQIRRLKDKLKALEQEGSGEND